MYNNFFKSGLVLTTVLSSLPVYAIDPNQASEIELAVQALDAGQSLLTLILTITISLAVLKVVGVIVLDAITRSKDTL